MNQIAQAMHYLKTQLNLNHRDMKPSNVLLFNKLLEIAKITDFGLSKNNLEITNRTAEYASGYYMSPELRHIFENNLQTQIDDEKSDVFSFGITFSQCIFLYKYENLKNWSLDNKKL